MVKVGLTGGIASGKSTVAAMLRVRGLPVLDADQVSRDILAPGSPTLARVVARFGKEILLPDGSLDRKTLGAVVVTSTTARKDLEAITHPAIRAAIADGLSALEAAGHPVAVVEAALLVETGSYKLYDALLVVAASPEVQLRRLMARENIDEPTASRWLAAQLPVAQKLALATAVVWNDGDQVALTASLEAAWAKILSQVGLDQ